MCAELTSPFRNGHWIWDDYTNSLQFISHEGGRMKQSSIAIISLTSKSTAVRNQYDIKFRDISDKLDKILFRRYHQRRVKPSDPDVVTIQDAKDVVLYMTNLRDLSLDFIEYFHTPTMDRFLRALVLYFQFYLDVWETLLDRRKEERRKLRQPIVVELENIVRDDLADLRCMVSKEYLSLTGGYAEAIRFHHMKDRSNSVTDKERKLFETLMCLATRVVWIALHRKHLQTIELELNRLFRSEIFNTITYRKIKTTQKTTPSEDRVLIGASDAFERKLLRKSPLAKEFLYGDHDYRMLGTGLFSYDPPDERTKYIEAAYAAPEELLLDLEVPVGLLGIPRDEFDPILMPRERTSKTYTKAPIEAGVFTLPPRGAKKAGDIAPENFLAIPCQYTETTQTREARKAQCLMWKKHFRLAMDDMESIRITDVRGASTMSFSMFPS